jgi:hypothetical protein
VKIPWERKIDFDGLASPRVFLSASVPSLTRDHRFLSGPAEPRLMVRVIETRVRDAVASFVVQLLRAGGQLIFGGHPVIVPMVAAAAESFLPGEGKHFPIVLYQSERYRGETAPTGREEMEARGIATVKWVPVRPEDAAKEFGINTPYLLNPQRFEALCRETQHDEKAAPDVAPALVVLRVVMFLHLRPQTILTMGGMEGISAEASLFRELRAQEFATSRLAARIVNGAGPPTVFALKSTYGATAQLDRARTQFIDESFFARSSGVRETLLQPEASMEIVGKQLMERIRYDGIMQDFVQVVADASSIR